jgi:hypothetical protein
MAILLELIGLASEAEPLRIWLKRNCSIAKVKGNSGSTHLYQQCNASNKWRPNELTKGFKHKSFDILIGSFSLLNKKKITHDVLVNKDSKRLYKVSPKRGTYHATSIEYGTRAVIGGYRQAKGGQTHLDRPVLLPLKMP